MDRKTKMLMFGGGKYAPPKNYEEEYKAVLQKGHDLGYKLPSKSVQDAQNILMADMKADGTFASEHVFYMFANDGSVEFATINWKDPESFRGTIPELIPELDANLKGLYFNPANKYIDSGWNASKLGNYQSQTVTYYIYEKPASNNRAHYGAGTSTFVSSNEPESITYEQSNTRIARRSNTITYLGENVVDSHIVRGFFGTSNNATTIKGYTQQTGYNVSSANTISEPLTYLDFYVGAYNKNGNNVTDFSGVILMPFWSVGLEHHSLMSAKYNSIEKYLLATAGELASST